jgi:LPS sulfotransferase NodH
MSSGGSRSWLVRSPVFILCAPRSGSTLLRKVLNAHSKIHAPGELNLAEVGVKFRRFPRRHGMQTFATELAFRAAGLSRRELEYLLWDRILHRELAASGKTTLVHKSPRMLLRWHRIRECWPDARYIFLYRHPMSIMTSGQTKGLTMVSWNEMRDFYTPYFVLLQEARAALPGLTVRYEDLTADPLSAVAAVCDYLGVDLEPTMLEYGAVDPGQLTTGTGDMSDKIRSGRVQPARTVPRDEDVPVPLLPICASLGYSTSRAGAAT